MAGTSSVAAWTPIMGSVGDDEIVPGHAGPGVTGGAPGAGSELLLASWGSDTLDAGGGEDGWFAGDSTRIMAFHSGGAAGAFPLLIYKFDAGGWYMGADLVANVEFVQGGALEDQIGLGPQDDALDGGAGADVLDGGAGRDRLVFRGEPAMGVLVDLGSGAARDAWGAWDRLARIEDAEGTGFADTLWGDAGVNALWGGAGDDALDGQGSPLGGGDLLDGGPGDDRYAVRHLGDAVVEAAGGGEDRVDVHVSGWALTPGAAVEALHLHVAGALAGGEGGERLVAEAGAATLDGLGGDDVLAGGAGDDLLRGGAGNDVLAGGAGADRLEGGAGDDAYRIGDARAQVAEREGEGHDTAFVAVDGWLAGPGLETLRLEGWATRLDGTAAGETIWANALLGSEVDGGGGNDVLWGGFGDDALRGGGGDDILLGVAGADRLAGGAGDDLYVLADAAALVVERPGEGRDTAWMLADAEWRLAEQVEVGILGGAARRLAGGAGDDLLVGNPALANALEGGGGHDQLYGGALADTLDGGAGDDAFLGLGGGDLLRGGAGNDLYVIGDARDAAVERAGEGTDAALVLAAAWQVPEGVEAAWLGGAGVALLGGAGAQILVGNPGLASLLDGGAGDDTLWGTAWGDVLAGGAGNDIAVAGGGADRLRFDLPAALGGWGHDSIFGLGAEAVLDFRGSGLAGPQALRWVDLGGATRLETEAGVVDFYASPVAALQAMAMLF